MSCKPEISISMKKLWILKCRTTQPHKCEGGGGGGTAQETAQVAQSNFRDT